MKGPVSAIIKLDAVAKNLQRVKELAPGKKVMSVIKSNAYGHGVLEIAGALEQSDAFAVARQHEALYLRKNGIDKLIVLLEGVTEKEFYQDCIVNNFSPVIHNLEQFEWLKSFIYDYHDASEKIVYWLKVDTGMHRLGLNEVELKHIIEELTLDSRLVFPVGMMTHFCCADEHNNETTQSQLTRFKHFCLLDGMDKLNTIDKSMANSAAVLSLPDAHYDWVRPGIMLYGISPFEASECMSTGKALGLTPAMTLRSKVIAVKPLQQGDCIGYGATWCCPEAMDIGIIAIGYGDGYPRHAPSGTPVLIHDIEVPTIGRVSMDMIAVDLRKLQQQSVTVKVGDQAILWGDNLPVERVSQSAGTIAYELICQLTQRVHFDYER
jgi:alanine racemase